MATAPDSGKGPLEVLLVGVEIIGFSGINDVDQVIGDPAIFHEVFACPDIHSPVHLPAVRRNDLDRHLRICHDSPEPCARGFFCLFRRQIVQGSGQADGISGFPRSRRSQDTDKIQFPLSPVLVNRLNVNSFRLRQLRRRRHSRGLYL